MRKIFVSIPSYKDMSSLQTVRDCIGKAVFPARLSIFVCEQNDKEPSCRDLQTLAASSQVSLYVDTLKAHVAQGPCFARAHIEQMMLDAWHCDPEYNDEPVPIVFMIDAHTLFASQWDIKLEEEMDVLPPNGILSHYPKNWQQGRPPSWNKDSRRTWMQIKRVNEHGIYLFEYALDNAQTYDLVLSKGLAAGCLAMRASVMYEVPYLREVPYLFIGEEMCMWMRLFCAGYDVYTPRKDIIQTTFARSGRANFSTQSKQNSKKLALQNGSIALVQRLMKLPRTIDLVLSDEWSRAFASANSLKLQVRSPEMFLDMLKMMKDHRGPFRPEALPAHFRIV